MNQTTITTESNDLQTSLGQLWAEYRAVVLSGTIDYARLLPLLQPLGITMDEMQRDLRTATEFRIAQETIEEGDHVAELEAARDRVAQHEAETLAIVAKRNKARESMVKAEHLATVARGRWQDALASASHIRAQSLRLFGDPAAASRNAASEAVRDLNNDIPLLFR